MTIAVQTAGKQWTVASETKPDTLYIVIRTDAGYTCDCLGFYHHGHCKHATALAAREARPYTSRVSPETQSWALGVLTGGRQG